jgi:uncharacterized metal-binding protein
LARCANCHALYQTCSGWSSVDKSAVALAFQDYAGTAATDCNDKVAPGVNGE